MAVLAPLLLNLKDLKIGMIAVRLEYLPANSCLYAKLTIKPGIALRCLPILFVFD